MGKLAGSQMCFGLKLDNDYRLPWDAGNSNYEDWWLFSVLGFRHSFKLYDSNGKFIGGVRPSEEKINLYYEEIRRFKEQSKKLPIELVNYFIGSYPMYILAIPSTCISVKREDLVSFEPSSLVVSDEQKEALLSFCKTYNIEYESPPAWYLSSYWG